MKQDEITILIEKYRSKYEVLAPDEDSIALTRSVWSEWEKQGVKPPDIDKITADHAKHENGFFYDIVKIAELHEGKKLNVHYCAFSLDSYNFYAISAIGGYVVLVDDIFFQLIFFLCIILTHNAYNLIMEDEKSKVAVLIKEIIANNYFGRKRFDFSKEDMIHSLLKRDYDTCEFANYLFHSLKAFIISHEIGHHVLLHTTGTISRSFSIDNNHASIEVDNRRTDCEFEADRYGYELLKKIYDTVDGSIQYAYCKYKFPFAPLFLFDLFRKFDQLQESKSGTPVVYHTHPHPAQRIEYLAKEYDINSADPFYLALKRSLDELIVINF